MPIRVGLDLVSTAAIGDAIKAHGARYLERVYSAREVEDCRHDETIDLERLAARFAAKEATLKVLRVGDQAVPWREIEVTRAPAGWVELLLSGRAASLAQDAGITDIALSLTHEQGFAAAIVVAELYGVPIGREMNDTIRQAVNDHARLPVDLDTLADDADLYQAGMTSHASVSVMLALEDAFGIEFPDRMLQRSVFESVASIQAALTELGATVGG